MVEVEKSLKKDLSVFLENILDVEQTAIKDLLEAARCANSKSDEEATRFVNKGDSTLIYQTLHEISNEDEPQLEGQEVSVAVKILTDPSDLSSLNNEYNVLRSLPPSCNGIRRALKKEKIDGMDAIYLEWIEGTCLKTWLEQQPKNNEFEGATSESDLLKRTEIAKGIASCLSSLHEAGVTHNDVASDNVIVSEVDSAKESKISMIDFGYATKEAELEFGDEGDRAIDDMPALTSLLREIFQVGKKEVDDKFDYPDEEFDAASSSGNSTTCSSTISPPRSTSPVLRRSTTKIDHKQAMVRNDSTGAMSFQSNYETEYSSESTEERKDDFSGILGVDWSPEVSEVLPKNLPRSIHRLLRDMMDHGSEEGNSNRDLSSGNVPYQSARELEEDLTQMLEDPKVYLFDPPRIQATGSIFKHRSPKVLHGRTEETEILSNACKRVDDPERNRTEVLVISGPSGTGKTSLVQWARRTRRKKGYFVVGKFDQLRGGNPYTALVVAINELCDSILAEEEDQIDAIRNEILTALGTHGKVLTDVIPRLADIIGEQPPVPKLGAIETQNRFKHAFQSFVQAVCAASRPVVLVLDDMQWADGSSIELVNTIVSDESNDHFLFIGCHRDDEVNLDHQVSKTLEEMEGKGVPVTNIQLGNMDQESVNALISERLRLPRRYTKSLAELVHKKTLGNAFFVKQFLVSLCDDGILQYSYEYMRWIWDEAAVEKKGICENVVELMAGKIKALSTEEQGALKKMSCVGSYFDEATYLSMISQAARGEDGLGTKAEKVLTSLISEGFIDKMRAASRYRFSHDRFQQAAYSLISKNDRDELHVKIGKHFAKKHSSIKESSSLFAAADQLNRGMACMTKMEDMVDLASLNAKAGEMAMMSSAFVPAEEYTQKGIYLLKDEDWDSHYDLNLRLHNILAEARYCNGEYSETRRVAETVFHNARKYEDKVPAYLILMKSFGVQHRTQESLDIGVDVLRNMGEPLPKSPSVSTILMELVKTKNAIRGKTDDFFLNLPQLKDERKLQVMQVLLEVGKVAFQANSPYMPLCVFRWVQLTIRNGLSKQVETLAGYGMMLIAVLGDVKGAYRFGRLAERMVKKLDAKDQFARVYVTMYGYISHWKDHVKHTLDPLLEAYHTGLEAGDIEFAIFGAAIHSRYSFWSGQKLEPLAGKVQSFCRKAAEVGHEIGFDFLLPTLQMCLNLMGRSQDPVSLTGDVMKEDQYLKRLEDTNNHVGVYYMHTMVSFLAYLFGNYELASERLKKVEDFATSFPGAMEVGIRAFYDGMTCFALARRTKLNKWRKRGRKMMRLTKKWAESAPSNYLHKSLLLQAENASLKAIQSKKKRKFAEKAYTASIVAARENGFIHDEALAYERASTLYREVGEDALTSRCIARSHELYLIWGAKEKAERLLKEFAPNIRDGKRRASFLAFQIERPKRIPDSAADASVGGRSRLSSFDSVCTSRADSSLYLNRIN